MSDLEKFMGLDLDISKIVLCTHVKAGTGKPTHRNRPSHGLVYYPEGGCEFAFLTGKRIYTSGCTVLYLPKGSSYDVDTISPLHSDCYAINFDTTTPFTAEPFSVSVKDSAYFSDAFRKADRIFSAAKSGWHMSCKAVLCGIIGTLQNEYSLGYTSGRVTNILSPALERIHETYTESTPSIPELACLCGISTEYFRAIFKKSHGKSPVKYISDLRLSRARELLSSGIYSVGDAALLSGFSDISYFSREYKKHFGVSAKNEQKKSKTEI